MRLASKIAIVTGAGRGIGRAIAEAMAEEGGRIVLVSRTQTEIEDVERSIRASGGQAHAVVCDVSDRAQVQRMITGTIESLGTIDILVNNAGRLTPVGAFSTVDLDEWLATLNLNLGSVLYCTQAVLPTMLNQRSGKIINLSGGGATSPFPSFTAYGASKTAVIRFTETLAQELKSSNIQVNAIAPGAVYTKLTESILAAGDLAGDKASEDAQRTRETGGADPRDAAELAVFLASSDSDGLTGRLLSAIWDDWRTLTPERIGSIAATDLFTLRRVVPEGN